MITTKVGGGIRISAAFAIAVFAFACTEAADSPAGPDANTATAMARSAPSTGITVAATTPSYGQRGETGKAVTITGSGFSPGAVVTWERSGVVDPNIAVQSATVVSSTQIEAVISISETADLSLYDVGVMNLDRKKGVGTEQFEVTTATSIGTFGGNTEVSGTNDQLSGARAVGWSYADGVQYAFYWPGPDGQMASLGRGIADAISADGATIAGMSAGYPVIWTQSGTLWVRSNLPLSAGAIGGRVEAMTSGADGRALIIAGSEQVKTPKGNGTLNRPRLWRYSDAGWRLDSLPMPLNDQNVLARSVNAAGQSVGGPRYWDEYKSLTELPGPAVSADAISADGTVIAGIGPSTKGSETRAIYWSRTRYADGAYGPWSAPVILPGSCARAIGVDSRNRILAHRCANASSRYVSALFSPPYDIASMVTLHGTGNRSDGGSAWAISPSGTLIGGRAVGGGGFDLGIIWMDVAP